jgi:hypothetical protein
LRVPTAAFASARLAPKCAVQIFALYKNGNMTRYETINSLGDNFVKLMSKSLIPVHVLDWKVYYEAYLKQSDLLLKEFGKSKKTKAAGITAAMYNISDRTIYNVIAFMEG